MTIDKRINLRDAGFISGRTKSSQRAAAPTRSSPFTSGMDRQQYSATQTQTGAVKGGGKRYGPPGTNTFETGFVSGDRGRESRNEFVRNVQRTNPGYTDSRSRNIPFLSKGIDYVRRNPQNIALGLMDPTLGVLGGIFSFLNDPERRKKLTGYETQEEYEQARQDRINLNRIKTLENTLQTKYLDKNRSLNETNLDERLAALRTQMGITPNTAADLRPDLDFSNRDELVFEGIETLAKPNINALMQPNVGSFGIIPQRKPSQQFIEELAPNLADPVIDQVGNIDDLMAKLATNSPALAQLRSLQKKQVLSGMDGGPEFTLEDQQKLNMLEEMEADPVNIYSQTV